MAHSDKNTRLATEKRSKRSIDQLTGFKVTDAFTRFSQRDEIYCRSEWDEEVMSEKASAFFQGLLHAERPLTQDRWFFAA